jgi:hypothetical protein
MGSSARCSIPERMLFGEVESEQMGPPKELLYPTSFQVSGHERIAEHPYQCAEFPTNQMRGRSREEGRRGIGRRVVYSSAQVGSWRPSSGGMIVPPISVICRRSHPRDPHDVPLPNSNGLASNGASMTAISGWARTLLCADADVPQIGWQLTSRMKATTTRPWTHVSLVQPCFRS